MNTKCKLNPDKDCNDCMECVITKKEHRELVDRINKLSKDLENFMKRDISDKRKLMSLIDNIRLKFSRR